MITKAGLKLGNMDVFTDIVPGMKSAKFIVNLKAGTTCLQGWFTEARKSRKFRAEFACVKRLGPADPASVKGYRGSAPDRLLKE